MASMKGPREGERALFVWRDARDSRIDDFEPWGAMTNAYTAVPCSNW